MARESRRRQYIASACSAGAFGRGKVEVRVVADMKTSRRQALKAVSAAGGWAALLAAGLVPAPAARAAVADPMFDATSLDAALKLLGAEAAADSAQIAITAPDVAEDGRAVAIGVVSRLLGTERIVILIDDNPYVVAANFVLPATTLAEVNTRVKMKQSSNVRVLVQADGRFFTARREVKVTVGGCGV